MRPSAILVNTSRGPICDEDALARACAEGRIAGAGLDAFGVEPLPADHPFRTLPNVVATPHIGYVSERVYGIFYRHIVEDIAGWLDGQPVRVVPVLTGGADAIRHPGEAAAEPGTSGGSGIRTHGELPHTRSPGVPISPLSHPSRRDRRPLTPGQANLCADLADEPPVGRGDGRTCGSSAGPFEVAVGS